MCRLSSYCNSMNFLINADTIIIRAMCNILTANERANILRADTL